MYGKNNIIWCNGCFCLDNNNWGSYAFSFQSEAKYSDATLAGKSATLAAGSSHINNYSTSSSSLKFEGNQRHSSYHAPKNSSEIQPSSNSFKDLHRPTVADDDSSIPANRGQQFAPPKPPRKKRPAPPPPTQNISSLPSQSLPQSVSVVAQVDVNHSRHSSHSSGFESAGSPMESPRTKREITSSSNSTASNAAVEESQTGNSLRATRTSYISNQKDMSVRPKEPNVNTVRVVGDGKKKKRMAPAPPTG